MAKRIKSSDLVFSKVWHKDNFLGLGGLYNMYIHVSPVSSASRYVIKGSKSRNPEGIHVRLIGVADRMTRATSIKTTRAPLMGI